MFPTAAALALLTLAPGVPAPHPTAPCCATSQDEAERKYELTIEPLGGGCYRLHYAGANIGVYMGPDGILLVDAGFLKGAPEIEIALAGLWDAWWEQHVALLTQMAETDRRTPDLPEKPEHLPVRYVVNTHFHEDHVEGNAYFGVLGARVVAHESVRLRLTADESITDKKVLDPPMDPEGVPTILFDRALTLYFNGGPVEIRHMPKAHTDGDCIVYVPAAKVLFAGDVYNAKSFPFIELTVGARPRPLIEAHQYLFGMLPEDAKIVPGHGPTGDIAALREFADMIADCDTQMRAEVIAGRNTLDLYNRKLYWEYEERWAGSNENVVRNFIAILWFCYAPVGKRGLGELDKEKAELEGGGAPLPAPPAPGGEGAQGR